MNGALGGYTRTTYSYNPELDEALKRLQAIATRYAPGGKVYKTQATALESSLQQGKRKSISNIAQQLVSAGLAGTTALPSAELGYEAEVMAPARTQLEAGLAQQQLAAELAIAQHIAQQQQAVQQMQYGATMQAAQLAAQRTPTQGTGFMQSAGGGGGGTLPWSTPGIIPSFIGTEIPTPTPAPTGTSAMRYVPELGYGMGVAPTIPPSVDSEGGTFRGAGYTGSWETPLQRVLSQPGYTASLVGYGSEGPGTYQGQGAAKLMYPEQWW